MNNILVLFLVLFIGSCSSMSDKQKKELCNYGKAFNIGFKDAKEKKGIQVKNWSEECPKEVQSKVINGYRSGYFSYKAQKAQQKIGQKEKAPDQKQCIKHYDKEVCGYGCVEAFGEARCAKNPKARCHEYKGEILCGVDCREVLGDFTCKRLEKR